MKVRNPIEFKRNTKTRQVSDIDFRIVLCSFTNVKM